MPPTESVAPPARSMASPPKSTTTVSTIAVRAGDRATMVIALLKADNFVHLRIDEMNPKLLSIGTNPEETSSLLAIHEDVLERLRSKQDQVHALLTRADSLGAEKPNPDEAVVYDAMARSLHQAWRELNRQLILRGYLLKEALTFYRMVRHHHQLTISVTDLLRRAIAGNGGEDIQYKITIAIDETLTTTAAAAEAGSSVIAQIRALATLDDSPERPHEALSSCLLIEQAMLLLGSEWEKLEATWNTTKATNIKKTEVTDEVFVQIEEWLVLSEKKVKALNETGQRRLIEEGNAHKAKLLELGASGAADGARVAHLSGRIEEFVHFLKTRLGRSQRITAFYNSAAAMLSQLTMMRQDMENANEAMAGELVPLARKKASGVIHEGKDISAKEVLTHEEQRLVKSKCDEMEARLIDLEEFAKTRKEVGVPQISQTMKEFEEWMEETVVTFLKTHGDMGSHKSEASQFVEEHKKFVDQSRDATVASMVDQRSKMSAVEQEHLTIAERQFERAKDALEDRIQLGRTFEQVHRFAYDLESSFDALQSLLDTNRDFTNERVAAQMDNVFEMIKETLSQEKAQGERFIASAQQSGKIDGYLRVDNAIETVKNYITDHGHRFTYITDKWLDWQNQKTKLKKLSVTVEEVEMWQEEAVEIIRLLQSTKITSQQDAISLNQRVKEFRQTMDRQTEKLQDAGQYVQTKEEKERMDLAITRQRMIEELIQELEQKITTTSEEFAQEEMTEKIHAPQILTELKDAQVDEGSRYEFVSRIEGEPEPTITWLKDGIDVKNNMDYRQDFVNGVASLVIEETFIEDTATYTVRAQNAGGVVESSAHLTVKSRSAASSAILEEDKPKFALQLKNASTTEGETARMECVIVGRPEPVVTWYKEEETVKEDERVRLQFAGDRCALEIKETKPIDTGLYTVKARNFHGETVSFSQLKVTPKKVAPVPPPKPVSRPSSVLSRPPSIQPALVNTSWEEGSTATLQVFTQGEPRPVVEWKFNGAPVRETNELHIQETTDGWSRLIISPVRSEHAGMYTVVAENEAGETTTGATLHVSKTTTVTEDHLQTEMYEQINMRPVETVEQTTTRTDLDIRESSFTSSVGQELSSIKSEKRWVDIIDEQLSQPSPVTSTIPVDTKTKATVTEHRWVDEIDELMGQPVQRDDYEKRTAETYIRVDELMSSTVPQAVHEAVQTTQHVEQAHAIHEAPQPEIQRGTTTPSSKMFNIATVRMSPQPEARTSTVTPGVVPEHVAISRQTPVPDAHTATITSAGSVENIAAIQQAPVPESHKATVTPGGAVANIAAIRQSPVPMMERSTISSAAPAVGNVATIKQTKIPESQIASTTEGVKVANIARVHTPGPEPERVQPQTDRTRIDRVDDVVLQPRPIHSDIAVTQKIETEGYVTHSGFDVPITSTTAKTVTEEESERRVAAHRQDVSQRQDSTTTVIENVMQKHVEHKEAPKTRMIPITTTQFMESGEGWVQDVREEMGKPVQTTTRHYTQEESLDRKNEKLIAIQPVSSTKTVTEDHHIQQGGTQQVISKIPIRREPVTTTTTTGEGWVKEIHEEAGQPTQTTVRQYTDEELAKQHNVLILPVAAERIVKERAETTAQHLQHEISKIPMRQEPTTTIKTITSGDGWVQEVREEVGKPIQSTFRQYTDEEAARHHNIQIRPIGAQSASVSQQATETSTQHASKIPLRREPVTTTTTKTSGDGWVKEIHEEIGKPASTQYRQFEDEHDLRQEVLRRQVDENYAQSEISKSQRDSYLIASDAEGFWTDGAYTGSPTPPPTRNDLGLSTTSTEPEFIRTFHNEYTVEEGEEITIECVLVGNPRPRVKLFFNDMPLRTDTDKYKLTTIHDTYLLTIKKATFEQAGYYKITAENKRGYTESLTVVHVRPKSLGKQPSYIPVKIRPEHTTVSQEFAMYEYEQRRPVKHDAGEKFTPPPAKKLHETHTRDEEHLERYELDEQRANGHPPHFTQTLVSAVSAEGETARFEGIVTCWPAPHVEWTKEGQKLEVGEIRGMEISNVGGRVALIFQYMCTAKNSSGVATSSAQLVVRPKTIAPDFVQRLISEEVVEGEQLKWNVRVTGDPPPKVTWMRDGIEIPNCDEVKLFDEGNGVHSLIIVRVETADSGQFTCLAENIAGEARSTADLVVRPEGTAPGNYFHVTKVTQEKQVRGEEPVLNSAFAIETPRQSEML